MAKKVELYLIPAKQTEGLFQSLFLDLERIKLHLKTLTQILPNDGKKVLELRNLISDFAESFEKVTGVKVDPIRRMEGLMWIFPALVLP